MSVWSVRKSLSRGPLSRSRNNTANDGKGLGRRLEVAMRKASHACDALTPRQSGMIACLKPLRVAWGMSCRTSNSKSRMLIKLLHVER